MNEAAPGAHREPFSRRMEVTVLAVVDEKTVKVKERGHKPVLLSVEDAEEYQKGESFTFLWKGAKDNVFIGEIISPHIQESKERSRAESPEDYAIVGFDKGRRVVYTPKGMKSIQNAWETHIIPGDRVEIEEEQGRVRARNIIYGHPITVAVRVEKDATRDTPVLVARMPGPRSTRKIKFPLPSAIDPKRSEKNNAVYLFNRQTGEVTTEDRPVDTDGMFIDMERYIALVNGGIIRTGNEQKKQEYQEEDQVKRFEKQWGIEGDIDTKSDSFEDAFSKRAEHLARSGVLEDLRGDPSRKVYVIDPSENVSHDDALSLKRISESEYEVGVHITDVASFVPTGTALDEGAQQRMATVYVGGRPRRMLPDVLSMHAVNLEEGKTRFTLSVIYRFVRDEGGAWKVADKRIVRAAIQATDVISYAQANKQLALKQKDEQTSGLRALRRFAEVVSGKTPEDSEDIVASFMTAYNKDAAEGFETLKRGDKKNLNSVEDIVLGLYRTRGISDPQVQQSVLKKLWELGIISDQEYAEQGSFANLLSLAHERVEKGGFELVVTEAYYKLVHGLRTQANAEYSSEDSEVLSGSLITRASSPARRYPDLVVQRSLSFLLSLTQRYTRENDITPEEMRALTLEYLTEVLGLTIASSDPLYALKGTAFLEEAGKRARTHLATLLAYANQQEGRVAHAESEMRKLHTLRNIEKEIRKEGRKGFPVSQGLLVHIDENKVRVVKDDKGSWIYGTVLISPKHNKELLKHVPPYARERRTVLSVKYLLPDGMQHPVAYCRQEGQESCRVRLPGVIESIERSQRRLIFKVEGTEYVGRPSKTQQSGGK